MFNTFYNAHWHIGNGSELQLEWTDEESGENPDSRWWPQPCQDKV